MSSGTCATPGHQDRPRSGDVWICNTCIGHLRDDLESVSALWIELEVTLTRQDVLGGDGGRRSAEVPLLFKPEASEARWVMADTIGKWSTDLARHLGLRPPERPARWLRGNVHELATHPAAGEAVDEIAAMVKLALRVIDRPPEKLFAGACPAEECDTVLWARPGDGSVQCRECDAVYDVVERREHMLIAAAVLPVTRSVGLDWVRLLMDKEIPDATWNAWVQRGKLHRIGWRVDETRGRRLPTYRFGQVQDLAVTWIARKGRAA